MKKTTALITTAIATLSTPVSVFAAVNSPINIAPPTNSALSPDAGGGIGLSNVVRFVINGLVFIGIIAALAFLIYGGIKWITSGGDKAGVESARNHIIAAIIGLVVILLAWVILNIVFSLLGLGGISSSLVLPTLVTPNG